jgi:hypothetical protein
LRSKVRGKNDIERIQFGKDTNDGLEVLRWMNQVQSKGCWGRERRTHDDIKTIDVDKAGFWAGHCDLLRELQVRDGVRF